MTTRIILSNVLAAFMIGCSAVNTIPALPKSSCSNQTLSRLYFGMNTPTVPVSEEQWQTFVKENITPRFPSGLTVVEANGQWLGANGTIVREPSRIVEIIHDGSQKPQLELAQIIESYKSQFQQEAVMLLTDKVTACFE